MFYLHRLGVTVPWLFIVWKVGSTNTQMGKCKIDRQQHWAHCNHAGLSEIPNSAFPEDTRKVDLSSNSIKRLKNSTFVSVRHLRILDLSRNQIEYLEPMAFEGLANLECLNLSYNPFTLDADIFSPTLFGPLVNLSTLRIQGYNIKGNSYVETSPLEISWRGIDKAFAMLSNLEELYMDFPENFLFGDGFANLTRLKIISTAVASSSPPGTCQLRNLMNATFVAFYNMSLKELRLMECKIRSAETGTFIPLRNLSVLDLSRNQLQLGLALKSLYGLQNQTMEEINFSGNNGPYDAQFSLNTNDAIYLKTICVRGIDISGNFFGHLETEAHVKYSTCLTLFGRPNCLESLRMSSYRGLRAESRLALFIILCCPSLKYLDVSGLSNDPVPIDFMSFSMKKYIEGKGQLLPSTVVTLNFSNALPAFPAYTLNMFNFTRLKSLDISNNIGYCDIFSSLLSRTKTITHLAMARTYCNNMNNSYLNIPLPDGDGFRSVPYLQEIDLSRNELTDIQANLFIYNIHLRAIVLSNNRLQRVSSAIMQMENISLLDLSVNAFTYLTAEEMSLFDRYSAAQFNKSSFHLNLVRNPLQCTCDTLDFIHWIYTTDVCLDNLETYFCVLSNGSKVNLSAFEKYMKNLSVSCISNTWLIIAVIGILFLSLLIVLCYVIYRYRTNLRYWFYTKLQPPIELVAMKECVFDAFVAYTEENYDWVKNDMCRAIENEEHPLKLCIHNRDFTPGKPIHENIIDKMRESRKIILVISVDFLSSSFGPLEIEYAGMKSLEEGREDLIICILREDIPVREMPKVLRNLWHKITFLKWSDDPRKQAHFWQQLRKAITDTSD